MGGLEGVFTCMVVPHYVGKIGTLRGIQRMIMEQKRESDLNCLPNMCHDAFCCRCQRVVHSFLGSNQWHRYSRTIKNRLVKVSPIKSYKTL